MPRKVTQKELATALKMSRATICMALKNHPRVARETKEAVQAAAARLGYERDPMLSALSAYSGRRRRAVFHGVLGWIVSSAEGLWWKLVPEYWAYYEGAMARAAELGYKLEIFDLHKYRTAPTQLARVLHSRGIRGALVCPLPLAHSQLEFPVDRVAVLVFGYTLERPALHRISAHHYQNMLEIISQLRKCGYKRIGYAVPSGQNDRLCCTYLSAYLGEQQKLAPVDRIAPLESENLVELRGWLRAQRPDAVITTRYRFSQWPEAIRARVPDRLGVAAVTVVDDTGIVSGVDECSIEIGRIAAQFVTEMVERGECGIPKMPQYLLVKSCWREGTTTRRP